MRREELVRQELLRLQGEKERLQAAMSQAERARLQAERQQVAAQWQRHQDQAWMQQSQWEHCPQEQAAEMQADPPRCLLDRRLMLVLIRIC